MTQVRWITRHETVPARPFWDGALLGWVFDLLGWPQTDGFPDDQQPCVLVTPGRMNWTVEYKFAERLANAGRHVLIVTSDEEGRFQPHEAAPNASAVWVQTPTVLAEGDRFLPLGAPPHPPAPWTPDRDFDWCFAGQITHDRRRAAVDAAQSLPGGLLVASDRFAAGIPPADYTTLLGRSRLVPCPSGPVHPETFRLYEALENGCVPIADAKTPGAEWGAWWRDRYPTRPFPLVSEWAELPDIAPALLAGWQGTANRCGAWWKTQKLDVAARLAADAGDLVAAERPITVVVTMSPIPSHPSLAVLAETVEALNEWGPAGPVVVACDGVRSEDEALRPGYEEAIAHLNHLTLHDAAYANVRLVLADSWVHQANLLRQALATVTTPLILFSEHDTPLCGPVPWGELGKVIDAGDANVIRLAHEASVHPEHRHLMVGDGPSDVGGVPLWRTVQFSARPHLASVAWYRRILTDWFPETSKGFVEDHLYSAITDRPWDWSRLFLYCPDGDIKRSWHTDGRAGAEKAPAFIHG